MRVAGCVAWSTPSRTVGPFPALISSVKIVSITSSLRARPPHVRCRAAAAGGQLDLQERTLLGVRLGHVQDEIVGEYEFRQWMRTAGRPPASPPGRRDRPRTPGSRSAAPDRRPGRPARVRMRLPCCTDRGSPGPCSPGRTASAPASGSSPPAARRVRGAPERAPGQGLRHPPTRLRCRPTAERSRSRRRCSGRSCRPGRSRPDSVNASLPVAIVFNVAGASMMNGSQRGPANTRTP